MREYNEPGWFVQLIFSNVKRFPVNETLHGIDRAW